MRPWILLIPMTLTIASWLVSPLNAKDDDKGKREAQKGKIEGRRTPDKQQPMNRTPSMSRTSPSPPVAQLQPQHGPQVQQVHAPQVRSQRQDRPQVTQAQQQPQKAIPQSQARPQRQDRLQQQFRQQPQGGSQSQRPLSQPQVRSQWQERFQQFRLQQQSRPQGQQTLPQEAALPWKERFQQQFRPQPQGGVQIQKERSQVPHEQLQLRQERTRQLTDKRELLRNQINQRASITAPRIDQQSFSERKQRFNNQRREQVARNKGISQEVTNHQHRSHSDYNNWFNSDFFQRHDLHVNYVNNFTNLWLAPGWASIAGWGDWDWSTPYYYDYGDYPIPMDNYYAPATVVSQPTIPADNNGIQYSEEWLPLGVFTIASNAEEAEVSNFILQLALSRGGELSGVFYDTMNDMTYIMTGGVDPGTQRAYWSLTGTPDSPILSTGIYNLTEEQTPVQVYFPDGSGQIWTLVRLSS